MIVLGIESSCDETAIALVEDGCRVISSEISSQVEKHRPFGGVIPEIAAREHLASISGLHELALQRAGLGTEHIDAVALTQGPGLIGPLLVGASFGHALALGLQRPLVGVDHVHAHIHGALLGLDDRLRAKLFPALALVVSGGHTNLYFMSSYTDFALIGYSLDDACGESFDKVAKLLGLGYPGGPVIEQHAASGDPGAFVMPQVIEQKDILRFSYSGLKTHVSNLITKMGKQPSAQQIDDLCASFQQAALMQIVRKVKQAALQRSDLRSVIVAGGVAANKSFQALTNEQLTLPCYFPKLDFCGDNAAMIAALGYWLLQESPSRPPQEYSEPYSRYQY